ncbi:uncharacterized protein [Arachis hypogaea]|uniref:uncharacterized protein n=1 Tax=Arachis hypogaea TaxID=3818 RepID=UPI003B221434
MCTSIEVSPCTFKSSDSENNRLAGVIAFFNTSDLSLKGSEGCERRGWTRERESAGKERAALLLPPESRGEGVAPSAAPPPSSPSRRCHGAVVVAGKRREGEEECEPVARGRSLVRHCHRCPPSPLPRLTAVELLRAARSSRHRRLGAINVAEPHIITAANREQRRGTETLSRGSCRHGGATAARSTAAEALRRLSRRKPPLKSFFPGAELWFLHAECSTRACDIKLLRRQRSHRRSVFPDTRTGRRSIKRCYTAFGLYDVELIRLFSSLAFVITIL